jgi:hypothetical protein
MELRADTVIPVVVVAIAITAAFLWDYHQQGRLDLPLRAREWHLLRLIGTVLTGISALWYALAAAGWAGSRPLKEGTRVAVTPFGPAAGPTWSEGWPAAEPVFHWLGAAGVVVLGVCTLGLYWPAVHRLVGQALGHRSR